MRPGTLYSGRCKVGSGRRARGGLGAPMSRTIQNVPAWQISHIGFNGRRPILFGLGQSLGPSP